MNQAYDEKALWQKARLFINHAMDPNESRTFDERALWASLALELLAKAALARVSPLLIASPNEDGSNLLIASGLVQGDGTFVSVGASTLFGRCAKVFRPFDASEAKKIARARNDYLHGGSAAFCPIPEQPWWASYWAQAIILVHAQDKTIADLVGTDREQIVEEHLARNRKNVEHRAEMLIARAKQRLEELQAGNMSARRLAEWNRPIDLRAYLMYSTEEDCPACGASGTIEGDDSVDSPRPHYEQVGESDWDSWMDVTVGASYFSCPACRLVLDGYELLESAGLPTEFEAETEMDFEEPDYGND